MTVVSAFFPWTNARDIHLLPGLVSPRLDQLLWIEDTTGNVRADKPPAGVTVGFAVQVVDSLADHGVIFDEATGEIEITSPLPAGIRLRSFIVVCSCSERAGLETRFFTKSIRVYVHEAIQNFWLTPSVLHVREGAENMRFGVLAQFDDGVIGDITNWSPYRKPEANDRTFVRRSGEKDVPALAWTPQAGDVIVDIDTGVLTCGSPTANQQITVARRPLPADITHEARGLVLGAPAWASPVRLTPVAGKGFAAMSQTRNILFLPEGFLNNPVERRQFGQIVRSIVRRLTYCAQTNPFDVLSQRQVFNYFMAWVPSPEPGVTILNELDRQNIIGTQAEGLAIDEPVPPRSGVAAWDLNELIYEVGLPTPVHDPAGSALGTEAAGRLHEWRVLFGEDITAALASGVYPAWLTLNDRVLLNELDTTFHLAMSDRPRVDGQVTEREVVFNKLRLTEADFDRFLRALTDNHGNAVGGVWATGGDDDDLVVLICRSLRNGGSNTVRGDTGHYLALTLGKDAVHHLEEPIVGDGFDLVADPIPSEASIETWTTVAHELAHSWTLKDEYGGNGLIGDDVADTLKDFANVQPRKTLLTANSLDADKIKWRWHRIEKAGVLAELPTDESGVGSGPFRVKMRKNHGYQFGRDDIVRLRTRPLATAVTSDRLRINKMLADGDLIELVLLPGSSLNVASFPAGSVLISPKRARNPDGSLGDELELLHASVRARINAKHNPLNATDLEAADRACTGAKLATPTGATNFPGGIAPSPPRYSSWIVGLHENGATYDCDVYRPTGVCIMREETFDEKKTGRARAYEFCVVCRYAIIDALDPTSHRDIDARLRHHYLK